MLHKENFKATSLTVTEGLNVTIYPHSDYGFLITTKELARAYGRKLAKIHDAKKRAKMIKGRHYLEYKAAIKYGIINHERNLLWTKEGFFLLANFLKVGNVEVIRELEKKQNFNNQTPEKLNEIVDNLFSTQEEITLSKKQIVDILKDICLIKDKNIRLRICNKLFERRELC